jgi:hypothetical protein
LSIVIVPPSLTAWSWTALQQVGVVVVTVVEVVVVEVVVGGTIAQPAGGGGFLRMSRPTELATVVPPALTQ